MKKNENKVDKTLIDEMGKDFFTRKGLVISTGLPELQWPTAFVKELIDNSLDALEEKNIAEKRLAITYSDDKKEFAVCDNAGGIPPDKIESIYDFTNRVSSKRNYRTIARGALGNALKTLIGIAYVNEYSLSFVVNGKKITYEPNHHSIQLENYKTGEGFIKKEENTCLPEGVYVEGITLDKEAVREAVETYRLVNPAVVFSFNTNTADKTYPKIDALRREGKGNKFGSIHFYNFDDFKNLFIKRAKDEKDATVKNFCKEFDGMTGKVRALSFRGIKPKAFIADKKTGKDAIDDKAISELYEKMKELTSEPKLREFDKKAIGKNTFTKAFGDLLKYQKVSGLFKRAGATIPFLIEGFLAKKAGDGAVVDSPEADYQEDEINYDPVKSIPMQLLEKHSGSNTPSNRVLIAINYSIGYDSIPFYWEHGRISAFLKHIQNNDISVSNLERFLEKIDFLNTDMLKGYTLFLHLICPVVNYSDRAKSHIYFEEKDADEYFDENDLWKKCDDKININAKDKEAKPLYAKDVLSLRGKLLSLTANLLGEGDYFKELKKAKRILDGHALPDDKEDRKNKLKLMKDYFMEAAEAATGNRTAPTTARQVFYAIRRIINQKTEVIIELSNSDFNRFTNFILTYYYEQDSSLEKIIFLERRGFYYDQVEDKEIPLGTKDTNDFITKQSQITQCEAVIIPGAYTPSRISLTIPYEFKIKYVLFLEKQGYSEMLKQSGLLEELGLAVIYGQGFSTRAQKKMISFFVERGIQVFALHDCDLSGYLIAQKLEEGGKTFKKPLTVIDIGLSFNDLLELNKVSVDSEGKIDAFDAETFQAQTKYKELYSSLTPKEQAFFLPPIEIEGEIKPQDIGSKGKKFTFRRVELNALTSPEFLSFIRNKIKKYGYSVFSAAEFEMDKKDIRQFRQAINDSNYAFGKMSEADDILDWINSKLSDSNLYEQIKDKQPHLILSDEIEQLIKQTEENRKKPFGKLRHKDKVLIRKLNRLMTELAHPHRTPKLRESIIIPGYEQLKSLIKLDKNELVKEAIKKKLTAAADMLYSKKADKYLEFIDCEDFTRKILADFYAEFESNQNPDTKFKWYKMLEQIIERHKEKITDGLMPDIAGLQNED